MIVIELWKSCGWRRVIHRLIARLHVRQIGFLVLTAATLTFDVVPVGQRETGLTRLLSGLQFDLAGWITGAAIQKIGYELTAPQNGMSDAVQADFVRASLRQIGRARQLETDIANRFADPAEPDPTSATAGLRAERDALRRQIGNRQPLTEAILQEQIESVLREDGFALGGQAMPPVRFRLTRLPHILIVSRRDRIERIDQRELRSDLTVDTMDHVERDVDARYDVSSLVTPIGGYATYPTMLPETTALRFIIETATHEWTHNYLLPSYVGLYYNEDPVARIINETAATIVQREVGERLLRRYYPEAAAAAFDVAALSSDSAGTAAAQQFDFNAEMRVTRLRTDDLLAQGRIEEAERYMKSRRALFVANGYFIRKLNQAYFAFYGAYNAEPGGAPAAGRDPVGPAVQDLRKRSPSLGAFIRTIAGVRTLNDVQTR
jgi:hypothetical protein